MLFRSDPTFDKVHSAVFPIELCNRVIKFYSYVGDLVFDPFAGSGTLGKSAINLERYFFMTEIDEKYINRIKEVLSESPVSLYEKLKIPEIINLNEFIQKAKLYDTNRISDEKNNY